MKLNFCFLIAYLFCSLTPANAERYGAISYDLKSNAYGVTWDQPSQSGADSIAAMRCATNSNNCSVVLRFVGSCGAYATGPNEIWGTGTGGSREVAEKAAKYFCDQQASPRGPFCRVRVWGCNTQYNNGQGYNQNSGSSQAPDLDANRRRAEEQRHWGGQDQYDRVCRESGGCGN